MLNRNEWSLFHSWFWKTGKLDSWLFHSSRSNGVHVFCAHWYVDILWTIAHWRLLCTLFTDVLNLYASETAFTRCRQILKTVTNSTDRPPVHTKTAHFCRQILKTVDFENRSLTSTFWKWHRVKTWKWKQNIFRRFWNQTGRFLGCRYISLTSKSCNEFFTVEFPTVFKLFRHRLNTSSNFATVIFFTVFKMCWHRVNAVWFYPF